MARERSGRKGGWKRVVLIGAGVLAIGLIAGAGWLYRQGFLDVSLGAPYLRGYSASLQPDPRPIAFVDVNVIPMDREVVLEGYTVLVRDGLIAEVGPAGEILVPAGALVIDGRGRYLMPGLVDMHVHVEEVNEILLFVANGVTSVRNLWGNTGLKRLMGLPDQLRLRGEIESGKLLGPTIYTSGPILEGPPASFAMPVTRTPAQAQASVAWQAAAGYDLIKAYDNLDPATYQATLDSARESGLDVVGHVPRQVGLEAVLTGGQRTIEHLTGYLDPDAAALLIPEDDLERLAALTAESGVWNVPTFVLWLKRLPTAADLERPEMRYVSPRMQRIWRTFARYMAASITYPGPDYAARMWDLMSRVTLALHRAGAGILLGTDTDNAYLIPGFSLHEELAYLVAAGLSPYEALRAGTFNAALAMGRGEEEFGSVSPGKRADLLLLESNALEDVANAQRRVGVTVRGRWFTEAQLSQALDELARSYRQ